MLTLFGLVADDHGSLTGCRRLAPAAGGLLQNLVERTRLIVMERAISASDANQRFSEMLRDVQEGETYVVMSRGRPVARVVPIDRHAQRRSVASLLKFVEQLPRRHAGEWTRDDLYN